MASLRASLRRSEIGDGEKGGCLQGLRRRPFIPARRIRLLSPWNALHMDSGSGMKAVKDGAAGVLEMNRKAGGKYVFRGE
jgi:hypothetical protein